MKNTVDAASQTTLGPPARRSRPNLGTHPPPMPKKQRLVQSRDRHTLAGFEGDWPQRTDVHRWHCAHGFDSFPVGIPPAKRDGVYTLQGVYCSFACMKAANSARPSHERALSGQLIHEMLREVYRGPHVVNKAPPKQMLAKFGGSMSIEEFRQSSAPAKSINLVTPPLMAVRTFYEEIPVVTKTTAFQSSKTFANTSAPCSPRK